MGPDPFNGLKGSGPLKYGTMLVACSSHEGVTNDDKICDHWNELDY